MSAQRGGSRGWLGPHWAEAQQPIPAFIPQYLNILGKIMAPAQVPRPPLQRRRGTGFTEASTPWRSLLMLRFAPPMGMEEASPLLLSLLRRG